MTTILSRAQGCLLGQMAGDSLGSLVEFRSPEEIRRDYADGVRDLADGGTWGTIAGQPTDDSELALALARTLVTCGTYDADAVQKAYRQWLDSEPFDIGGTTMSGLTGSPNLESQANGALMRISPLGIFGANLDLDSVAEWARQDAMLTHPNPVCQQANMILARVIAHTIRTGDQPRDSYRLILSWAEHAKMEETLLDTIRNAHESPPSTYTHQQGWVLIALQNAFWQFLHAPSIEEGVIDSIMRGGDTDTNAAICGALLGAAYGKESVPERWIDCLLNCRPKAGNTNVRHPRPECYWPVDALSLAAQLINVEAERAKD